MGNKSRDALENTMKDTRHNSNLSRKKKLKYVAAALMGGVGVAVGTKLKLPKSHEAAKRFSKNVGGNLTWYGTDDANRMKDLGITYSSEAKSLGINTKRVKDIKPNEKLSGGFYGHRGDMSSNFGSDADFNKASLQQKIYNIPSVTKDLEDNWKWYKQVEGDGVPKTVRGDNIKNSKDIKKVLGGDYLVKSRFGWGNKGIVSKNDFNSNPNKYLTKDYVLQKKENLKREYRVLVAEGKGVYTIPRRNNEFVTTPTPHLSKEKDRVLNKAEEIVKRMKKHKNDLHSLDLGVTSNGKIVAWEDNSAQGGNMFLRGDHLDAFKMFSRGKAMPSYAQKTKGTALQVSSAGGSAAVIGHEKFSELKDSLHKMDSATDLDNKLLSKRFDKKTRKNLGVAGMFGVSGGSAIMASKRLKDFRIPSGDYNGIKNVAILHSPSKVGGGHKAAAEAMAKKLNKVPGVTAKTFDTGNYGSATFNDALKKVLPVSDYETAVQKDPSRFFRNHLATFPKQTKASGVFSKIKNSLANVVSESHSELSGEGRALAKGLRKFKPDKIVSTYFGSTPGLKDSGRAIDLITTDYEISPFLWKTKNSGAYFTSSKDAKKAMENFGVSSSRVVNIGEVPVSRKAWPKIKTGTSVKNVVVMGGQLGLRTHEVGPEVSRYYKKNGKNVRITILPGKTGTLARDELSRAKKKGKLLSNVHVWDPKLEGGSKSYMKYMAEADLIITRPGGATTAELRSLGKPTVTFSEVPKDWQNHEGGNIRALASTGQSKHMELPLKIDTDSKALKRAVSSALKSVDKDYGKMVEGGKEAAIDSLANQNSMAKKVLSTKSFTSRAKSLPFKAWIGASAGTGALGLVGAYLAKKGKNK